MHFRGWQLNQQSAQSSVDDRRRRYDTRVVVEGAKADAALLPCQLHLGNVPGYTDWHSRVDPGFGTSVRALRPSLKSLLRAVSNARRHDIKNREEQAELGQYILHRFKNIVADALSLTGAFPLTGFWERSDCPYVPIQAQA